MEWTQDPVRPLEPLRTIFPGKDRPPNSISIRRNAVVANKCFNHCLLRQPSEIKSLSARIRTAAVGASWLITETGYLREPDLASRKPRSDLRRCKVPTPESSCHIGWPFSLQAAQVQIRNQKMRRLTPHGATPGSRR